MYVLSLPPMLDTVRDFINYTFFVHGSDLITYTSEHIHLTFLSLVFSTIFGVLLGLSAFYWRFLYHPILLIVRTIQTIPSLALLALLLVICQSIGKFPAVVALTLYALLPIVVGTLTGLETSSPILIETGESLGLTRWQQMRYVRFPLAIPQLIAGIRLAATLIIGMVTIAAFIGAGGLGQLINRGLFLADNRLILLGALPAALLAIMIDGMIGFLQKSFSLRYPASYTRKMIACLLPIGLWALALYGMSQSVSSYESIRVGTKNFTEQLILGEIMAQTIEKYTSEPVSRKFSLGGSLIAHHALIAGEIDLYAEYSGTAMTSVFNRPITSISPDIVLEEVCRLYRQNYHIHCLKPLGFNNTYVLAMRKKQADELGITRLSQLKAHASRLRASFDFEFASRPDGYAKLKKNYGIVFASISDMEPSLMYKALDNGATDIISAYSTDGRLTAYNFVSLEDDIGFFPPYQAFIIVSDALYQKHPDVIKALERLSGTLDNEKMQYLNNLVDHQKEELKITVQNFIK